LEDPELMAEDEDLEILGAIVLATDAEETGEHPNDQAEERQRRRILRCGLIANLVEIARAVTPRPITDVAHEIGFSDNEIEMYGSTKAKIIREEAGNSE
jgi:hypothetical protein